MATQSDKPDKNGVAPDPEAWAHAAIAVASSTLRRKPQDPPDEAADGASSEPESAAANSESEQALLNQFATAAMQGLLPVYCGDTSTMSACLSTQTANRVARLAWRMAHAMLAMRDEPPPPENDNRQVMLEFYRPAQSTPSGIQTEQVPLELPPG